MALAGGSGETAEAPVEPPILGVEVMDTTVLVTGGAPQDWHGRATIKILNSGVWVLVYRTGSAHNVNDGALHIKFSDDGGATWTAPDTKLGGGAVTGFPMNASTLSSGQDASDPWMYYLPDDDKLILHMWRVDYFVSAGGTWQTESTDGGETWTTSHGPITFADPSASSSTHLRTFCTEDDFIDPNTGDLYATARIYTSTSQVAANHILVKTSDLGVTWERVGAGTNPRVVTTAEAGGRGGIESGMEYLGDGRIIVAIRDGFSTHSYHRFSDDMGETWGPLLDTTSQTGIAARQRIYTVDHLQGNANWWEDPRLIMVGFVLQTPGQSQGRRNAVWLSEDAGETWTAPFYVDAATPDAGYGDIKYDAVSGLYRYVSYRGTIPAADLVQYDLEIVI